MLVGSGLQGFGFVQMPSLKVSQRLLFGSSKETTMSDTSTKANALLATLINAGVDKAHLARVTQEIIDIIYLDPDVNGIMFRAHNKAQGYLDIATM